MKTYVVAALALTAVPPLGRLWVGPTLWDRLAGAASLNVRVALALAAEAAFSGHGILLDVSLAYAILGFVGTVLVARFAERGGR